MKSIRLVMGLLVSLACANFSFAHHSTANFNFEEDQRVTITGTVSYWSFSNPHSYIDVDVTDEEGNRQEYTVFLTSRVVLQRYGWRPDSIEAGDEVTIIGSPDRGKSDEMYLQRIVFADGSDWNRDEVAL